MKKILIFFILFSLFSCKGNKIKNSEKNSSEKVTEGEIIPEIQEIGNLFRPEMMEQEEIKIVNGKNNYQYTITNSDLLDTELENTEKYAKQIVNVYYKFLIRINNPFNYDKIITKIIHRNGKIESFKFSEKDFLTNEIEFTINTKFTIKVIKIDDLNFKCTILKAEPYNKKLEMWNTENLFEENGETETIEFYFAETDNKNYMLVMQSKSQYSIKFKSEIQTEENGKFIEIQNVGTHKGSKTTESWAKKTYKIRLSKFELKK